MFADDTNLAAKGETMGEAEEGASVDLKMFKSGCPLINLVSILRKRSIF